MPRRKTLSTGPSFGAGIAASGHTFCRAASDKLVNSYLRKHMEKGKKNTPLGEAPGTPTIPDSRADTSSARTARTFTIKPHGPTITIALPSPRGFGQVGYSLMKDLEELLHRSKLNIKTSQHSRAFIERCCTADGRILNVASTAAFSLVR